MEREENQEKNKNPENGVGNSRRAVSVETRAWIRRLEAKRVRRKKIIENTDSTVSRKKKDLSRLEGEANQELSEDQSSRDHHQEEAIKKKGRSRINKKKRQSRPLGEHVEGGCSTERKLSQGLKKERPVLNGESEKPKSTPHKKSEHNVRKRECEEVRHPS